MPERQGNSEYVCPSHLVCLTLFCLTDLVGSICAAFFCGKPVDDADGDLSPSIHTGEVSKGG